MTMSKEEIMKMATDDIETILNIIGDLGHVGYKIALCVLNGNSYQQCANKHRVSKQVVYSVIKKCNRKRYDISLKKIFQLK